MTLRKITVDNSVRYNPITKKTKEKEIKPKPIKADSLPHKKPSQNKKKFLKNISASGFKYLK